MERTDYEKKVVRLHLIYWAIIFISLAVFLLLIAPGSVNPKAFENFSFASTLVSIVLAVVSIVYSFRTKSNASENIAGIREIERNIETKLERFDSLKVEIVEEVRGITRPIEDEVSNIRQGQKETYSQMREMLERMTQKDVSPEDSDGRLLSSSSFYGNVIMYILCKASQSRKEINLEKMGLDFNDNYEYFWGFWIALSALKGHPLDCRVINHRSLIVTKYDEALLGSMDYWKSQIMAFKNEEDAKRYLEAVDSYFAEGNTNSAS